MVTNNSASAIAEMLIRKPVSKIFEAFINATFVSIVNVGFTGNAEKIISQVRNSTEGFTLVLAGLKTYLEHNLQFNLMGDRFAVEN